MKVILPIIMFAAGLAVGVGWGVHHPSQATSVSSQEDAAVAKVKAEVAKAKIALLEKFLGQQNETAPAPTPAPTSGAPAPNAEYRKMLDEEKQNLHQAETPATPVN